MCAPDMRAPKVVNIENSNIVGMTHQYLPKAYWVNNAEVDLVNDPYVTYSQAHEEFKLVIWELGRRCNYDCWYCGPDAHNTYESQKTLGSLLAAVRQLQIIWLNSQPAKFVFAGGESTFNPDFMEFANHLHKDGHRIHTTTNGSHTTAYYTELARISDISFSAHLSYLETPNIAKKFIANVAAATINAGLNYIEVRIMLQPGKLLQAQELHTRLIEVTPRVTVDLLHNETKTTIEYTAQEVQWATSHQ
jgi:molybdenum cofactor biosynthesis enzyme MoaA